jgi:hypothetical protein
VAAAIHGQQVLVADGRAGLRVVRILEAAERSIKQGGSVIALGTQHVPRRG